MLDRTQPTESAPISRADKVAILRTLADVLPFDGIIVDDHDQHYPVSTYCPYERNIPANYLHAEVQPMQRNMALVKLRQLKRTANAGEQNACTSLFVLAKSDGEWEMMGQPLPFGQLRIPA